MQYFFDDLELPRLVHTQLLAVPTWKKCPRRLGGEGTPNNLDVVRSMRGALGRRDRARLAARSPSCTRCNGNWKCSRTKTPTPRRHRAPRSRHRDHAGPHHADSVHRSDRPALRNRVKQPMPSSKAVMFCLMDVSGSMDEARKDLSKRFFILLYLFLTRNYEKIEVVFIRHHTQRRGSRRRQLLPFDRNRRHGGVQRARTDGRRSCASAIRRLNGTSTARRPRDGDNWHRRFGRSAASSCRKTSCPKCATSPMCRCADEEQNLWEEYAQLAFTAPELRDAQGRIGRGHLSGVSRTVQETAGGCMTTRHLHNEARGYHLDGNGERGTDDRAPSKLEVEQRSAPLTVRKEGSMNVAEKRPLPCPSDWTFELIEQYDTRNRARRRAVRAGHLSEPARGDHRRADDGCLRVGRHAGELPALVVRQAVHRHREELPARPDGPGVRDRHQFESLHRYLMEENTMAMQALVIAHAAYGHNSSSRATTCSACGRTRTSIIDYLVYAKNYIAECEERHGIDRVEELLDSCHALMNYGVDRYKRPQKLSLAKEAAMRRERETYLQSQVNDLWRTLPNKTSTDCRGNRQAAIRPSRRRTCCTSSRRTRRCSSPGNARCAHRAQGRAVLLSAAPDAGDERRLGHVLALHAAEHALRRRPARPTAS